MPMIDNANSADNAINANNVSALHGVLIVGTVGIVGTLLRVAQYQAVHLLIKPYCADKGSTRVDRPSLAIDRR
jgi:hypothetical protein